MLAWKKSLPHEYYHWSKASFQLVRGGPGSRSVGSQVFFRQSKLLSSHRSIRSFSLIFQWLRLFSILLVVPTALDRAEYWLLDVTGSQSMVHSFAFFIYPHCCYHYYYTNISIFLLVVEHIVFSFYCLLLTTRPLKHSVNCLKGESFSLLLSTHSLCLLPLAS